MPVTIIPKLDHIIIFVPPQCQRIVRMKLMPYCTLLPNFLQGELTSGASCINPKGCGIKDSWHVAMCLSTVCLFCVSFRYGETHPMFFIGSLEAASQEAFYGKARDVSQLINCSVPHRRVSDL